MSKQVSLFILSIAVILAAAMPENLWAYNNTSLKWRTISTKHFEVHYHQGEDWTAQQVAEVAEEVHPFLTALYNYEPKDKVHFIIKDTDDYANGATYYYDNKIEIWATNLEFGFRGTCQWIRNVVTHEYTHLVSLQAGFKFTRRVPGIYFQLIDFEKEKRPDVLTGYPSNIASYPISGSVIPPWFAEGTAQYQSPQKEYDCWDTHRDMILRCAVLEDKMLSYDEMGFFGHSSMGNEEVYDHGFGLVKYIADTYGPNSLDQVVHTMRSPFRYTFDGALKKATGKKGIELYEDWKEKMMGKYTAKANHIREHQSNGKELFRDGFMTVAPSWSPDGKKIAFLSNRRSDYSETSLYTIAKDGKELKLIKDGVETRAVFSADGQKLLYSRLVKIDRYGSEVNDLYLYDLKTKKEKRLTRKLRASHAAFSPDNRKIVCVLNKDGTHKLALMDVDGKNITVIFDGEKGMQLYSPQFSPDGKRILFGIFKKTTRDIAVISSSGNGFHYLVRSVHDERDASWLPDGESIVFSSDREGVFNIYELNPVTSVVTQKTNVIGGAFMPEVSLANGDLVYAAFRADGYGLEVLDNTEAAVNVISLAAYEQEIVESPCAFLSNPRGGGAEGTFETRATPDQAFAGQKGAQDTDSYGEAPKSTLTSKAEFKDESYKPSFTSFQFYPRFILYDRSPRLGIMIVSNEMLDKQSLMAGASIGTNKEFDAYASYEFRYFYPTLFADIVRLREYYSDVLNPEETPWEIWDLGLRYDLWEFDLGLRFELEDIYSITNRNEISLFFTHGEYSVHIDPKIFDKRDNKWSLYSPVGWKYYIGNEITLRYWHKKIARAIDSDINPRGGREFTFEYMRAFNKLFTSGEFDYGLKPSFDKSYFNQYSMEWIEYIALPYLRHTLQLKLYTAAIDKKVDDFFYIYMGGRDYLRGYTYYSIGGRKALLGSATYRFPVLRNINRQFLHLYLRDVYVGVFYEAATAWNDDNIPTTGYRKAVGGELRVNMGSYYTIPTTLSIVSAYALDEFSYRPVSVEVPIRNKRGLSTYVTLGFTF